MKQSNSSNDEYSQEQKAAMIASETWRSFVRADPRIRQSQLVITIGDKESEPQSEEKLQEMAETCADMLGLVYHLSGTVYLVMEGPCNNYSLFTHAHGVIRFHDYDYRMSHVTLARLTTFLGKVLSSYFDTNLCFEIKGAYDPKGFIGYSTKGYRHHEHVRRTTYPIRIQDEEVADVGKFRSLAPVNEELLISLARQKFEEGDRRGFQACAKRFFLEGKKRALKAYEDHEGTDADEKREADKRVRQDRREEKRKQRLEELRRKREEDPIEAIVEATDNRKAEELASQTGNSFSQTKRSLEGRTRRRRKWKERKSRKLTIQRSPQKTTEWVNAPVYNRADIRRRLHRESEEKRYRRRMNEKSFRSFLKSQGSPELEIIQLE